MHTAALLQVSQLRAELGQQHEKLQAKEDELESKTRQQREEWQRVVEERIQKLAGDQAEFLAAMQRSLNAIEEQSQSEIARRELELEEARSRREDERNQEVRKREEFEEDVKMRYETMLQRMNRMNR